MDKGRHADQREVEKSSAVRIAACVLLASAALACGDGPTETLGPPAHIEIVSGNAQQAVVGDTLAASLVVRVLDTQNRAVPGQLVSFQVMSGNGSVETGLTLTDAHGIADDRWVLGTATADSQQVTARAVTAADDQDLRVLFRAIALPDAPAGITRVTSETTTAPVGSTIAPSPTVRVSDQYGNPVPGVSVSFAVTMGDGSVSGAEQAANTAGEASVGAWLLGPIAGENRLAASVTGLPPVTFTATAMAGAAAQLVIVTQPQGSVRCAQFFSVWPVVQVADAFGNAVPEVSRWITAAIDSGGGVLGGTTQQSTDVTGATSFPALRISGSLGVHRLAFSSPGLMSAVSSPVSVTAGLPATIEKLSLDPQTDSVGSALVPPKVRVREACGHLAIGDTVTFRVSSFYGQVSGSPQVTGSDGVAEATSWHLGGGVDVNTVEARTSNGITATFSASAVSGGPASLTFHDGNSRTAQAGSVIQSLTIDVKDRFGNRVRGAEVTVAVTSGGGSTSCSRATEGLYYYFTCPWTLGPSPGQQTLEVRAAGAAPAVYTVTATP